jgi:hypothetical protein
MNIVFLHHSTGGVIWKGNSATFLQRAAGKISSRLAMAIGTRAQVPHLVKKYNRKHQKNYLISEMIFPKAEPYGWHNYPYDYYNIWVKNAGDKPYMEEPTLEILTKTNQVIIFKHCFPVSNIQPDTDTADINSNIQTLANYKLQYEALRNKLHEFPQTKFILFTGAALIEKLITEEEAGRSKEFFTWVTEEWDVPDDNIFIWDLYSLETEGGLYFKKDYAVSENDAHPNVNFAGKAADLFFRRLVDIIENNGKETELTGVSK